MASQQAQNTFLRERFLRTLAAIVNRPARFTLAGSAGEVSARFVGADVDILHFEVADLQTPIGVQPCAILRATDVTAFDVRMDCGGARGAQVAEN